MNKEGNFLEIEIKETVVKFLEAANQKEILIVSHFDTDGITSAAIMAQALKKLDKKFSVKIVKSLQEDLIHSLPKNKLILFLDLASGSLNHIKNAKLENVFIIDHHEIIQEIPENITILNPMLSTKESINSSSLTYLFCKEINSENKKFAKLAVLGMIGDWLEKSLDKLNNSILEEGEIIKKRGLLIYPSTRPLNRTLEYCSQPYIPGVTGNPQGVLELLREAEIGYINKKYKSLIELDEEEMKKLITAIMLRNPKTKSKDAIGDIYLLKFFNKLEDAREICAMINGCSRMGRSDIALKFCMEISGAKKEAESIYVKYKQHLISALDFVSKTEKISGPGFVIINAKNEIIPEIAGTIASILSNSSLYEEGTVIITMAYDEDKIKVSARNAGRSGGNVREILNRVVSEIGGEVGGHKFAAGCNISKNNEETFINNLIKNFEVELVKV